MARLLALMLLLALTGCASIPVAKTAELAPGGGQVVTIEMDGFTFRPDVVTLKAGVPVTITAVSHSRIPHNITILSPDGSRLADADIAPRVTDIFTTTLPAPGRYVFYCDKFLHRFPFRMEGVLVAE